MKVHTHKVRERTNCRIFSRARLSIVRRRLSISPVKTRHDGNVGCLLLDHVAARFVVDGGVCLEECDISVGLVEVDGVKRHALVVQFERKVVDCVSEFAGETEDGELVGDEREHVLDCDGETVSGLARRIGLL